MTFGQILPSASAAEFRVFRKTYIRDADAPDTVRDQLAVLNPATTWTLRAINGSLEDSSVELVSSSTLALNDVQILKPSQFNQTINVIQVPVTLQALNTVATQVRSRPGGQMTVEVVGQDGAAPVAAWQAPVNGLVTNAATVPARLLLRDDVSGLDPASLTITLDGVSVRPQFTALAAPTLAATLDATLAPAEGHHLLGAAVKDMAGQPGSASVPFTVDRTPPTIHDLLPADGTTVATPRPAISAGLSDSLSGVDPATVRLTIDGIDVTAQASVSESGVALTPAADLADGLHAIRVDAADRAGNATTATATFTIRTIVTPPVTSQSGFIHGVVLHAVTEQPIANARITFDGLTGEMRSGTDGSFQIPTPAGGTFFLTIAQSGFASVQRQVEVLATRDAVVEPALLTPLDPQVTLISQAAGGLATDSTGDIQVDFPAGAAPSDLQVRITPLPNDEQLPSPIPVERGHVQAVYFEPRFTTFVKPVTFRARNTMGFAPNTPLNLEQWDEFQHRWVDMPGGVVTPDGQWMQFSVVRFFCWYCIWLRKTRPAQSGAPNRRQVSTTESSVKNPGLQCPQRDNSAVCPESGELSEEHALPSLRTLGQARSLIFAYRSAAADPSALIGTDYAIDAPLLPGEAPTLTPQATSATIQIEGRRVQATFVGSTSGARQAFLWDARNGRGQRVPTGAYPYTVALSNNYSATFGATGVSIGAPVPLTTTIKGWAIIQNHEASPFGAGWSLHGLQRLLPQPDGTVLVADGTGAATVFRSGPNTDLAVANFSSDDVSLLVGHGDGTFQPQQRFAVSSVLSSPVWLAAGDFNGDGLQDLAVVLNRTGEVAILLGQGGRFQAAAPVTVGSAPRHLAVGDVNRDGVQDLVVANAGSNDVSILLGHGDGAFSAGPRVPVGEAPFSVALGDVNRDGALDLVTANQGTATPFGLTNSDLSVALGNGDGTFQAEHRFLAGTGPTSVAVADFNADGILDLVVANASSNDLSLLLGRGDGTFQPAQRVLSGVASSFSGGANLVVADFNGDAVMDVAVTSIDTSKVSVLLGAGDGTFQAPVLINVGIAPFGLVAADLNHDGAPDLAIANQIGNVALLLGRGDGTFEDFTLLAAGGAPAGLVAGFFDESLTSSFTEFSGLPGDFSRLRRLPDGTWIRRLPDGTQMTFDARGFHTATTDRNGNQTRYTYDAQDRPIEVAYPGNAAFTLSYDGAGRLASIADSAGRTTAFLVDGQGDLARITNPDGISRQFTYDLEHRLINQTNERGFTTEYRYEAFGRLAQATLPERPTLDPSTGSVTLQREVRRFTPSETQGLINALPAGVGTPANPAAPVATPLAAFKDGQGHTTQLATDHFGAPTKLIDPLGRVTLIERDVNGLPTKMTRPNSAQTLLTYDGMGNLTSTKEDVIAPSFQRIVFQFEYDPVFSQVTKIIDARRDSPFDPFTNACPNGCTTRIERDATGNPLRILDHLGNVTSFTYDSRGLLLTVTDALGNLTPAIPDDHQSRFTYGPVSGNLVSTTDPLGNASALSYDAFGNVAISTDANTHTTTFTYDAMNRLTQVRDAAGASTQYDYDAAGNLLRVTDANVHPTIFAYDSLNLLASVTNALNQPKQFFYDANRNLAKILDPKGQAITFSYDATNQLKTKTLKDPSGAIQDAVAYDYDSLGNLVLVQDSDSRLAFAYDSAGRLLKAKTGDPANPALAQPVSTFSYSYDPVGHRTSADLSAALVQPVGVGVRYSYDGLNRLTSVNSPNLFGRFFEYDALSRLTRQFGGPPTTFTYDDASQLRTLHTLLAGVIDEQFDYAYDRVGNRQSLTDRFGLHSYGYDALNRLVSAAHPLASGLIDELFAYDPVGNRRSSHLSTLHRYEAANRLLEDDQFTYTYDANGNLTSKTTKTLPLQTTTYTYDVENQLTQVDLPTGTIARYRYDGLGRRIEKAVSGTIQRFLYDQEDIWLILNGTTNCATHAVLHGPGIDQPLAFVKDTNADCTFNDAAGFGEPIVYLQSDGLGSITSLISETHGFFRSLFLAERYTYDSFGQPTITAPDGTPRTTSAFGNPYLFTGREYDFESGLAYHRRRYRDPTTGRWLQEDPVFSTNRYPYVENNPVNRVDPLGEFSIVAEGPLLLILLGIAAAAAVIASQQIIGSISGGGPIIHWQSSEGQTCPVAEGAEKSVDDVIKGATPRKVGKSKIYEKPGGVEGANEDFDSVAGKSPVKIRPGGVRTTELPDGTTISVRPKSNEGPPTIQVNRPKGPAIKVRYR